MATTKTTQAPELTGNAAAAIRPFEEQTQLERALRSHLWHPTHILTQSVKRIAEKAKQKNYQDAAEWQTRARSARSEIEMWENLLELYEAERHKVGDEFAVCSKK